MIVVDKTQLLDSLQETIAVCRMFQRHAYVRHDIKRDEHYVFSNDAESPGLMFEIRPDGLIDSKTPEADRLLLALDPTVKRVDK